MSWPEAPITVEQFTAPTASRESKFPAPKWPAIARQIRKTYRRQSKQILAGVVVVLVALLSIVGSRLVHHSTVANDAKTALSREGLVARVGRLTELPAGEQPMVYTVTDQARLSQPFLKNAKTGDQVLIYQQAGRAIVYRTSTDKVVAIGPLTGAQSITQSTDVSAQPSIALYNGSQTAGVTSNFEQKLTSLGPLQVVMREKAARSDYARSQVIDVGGTKSDMAKKIAVLIDADVVALPASETAPQADILIIIGNSQK